MKGNYLSLGQKCFQNVNLFVIIAETRGSVLINCLSLVHLFLILLVIAIIILDLFSDEFRESR